MTPEESGALSLETVIGAVVNARHASERGPGRCAVCHQAIERHDHEIHERAVQRPKGETQ